MSGAAFLAILLKIKHQKLENKDSSKSQLVSRASSIA
jgi:hypothetical protein